MYQRGLVATIGLTAAACFGAAIAAHAFDDAKYPPLTGQWTRAVVPGETGLPPFDPAKPPGRGQQAPLTPEYQAKFEATPRRARRQRTRRRGLDDLPRARHADDDAGL